MYDARIDVLDEREEIVDSFATYVGVRTVTKGRLPDGSRVLELNGEPVYQVGLLDQGFWPDGVYAAPSDAELERDVLRAKELGFNLLRKHIKVEPRRWYHHCDVHGMLVWQDWPSRATRLSQWIEDPESPWLSRFIDEGMRHVRLLRNHPSIVTWVPFNEGWGQPVARVVESVVRRVSDEDPTRLVNDASGGVCLSQLHKWFWGGCFGDYTDQHVYPGPSWVPGWWVRLRDASIRAIGEYGGIQLNVEGKEYALDSEGHSRCVGYDAVRTPLELAARYARYAADLGELLLTRGVVVAVYTQLSDVELECNGLWTYDRTFKGGGASFEIIRKANEDLKALMTTYASDSRARGEPKDRWRRSIVASGISSFLDEYLPSYVSELVGEVVEKIHFAFTG